MPTYPWSPPTTRRRGRAAVAALATLALATIALVPPVIVDSTATGDASSDAVTLSPAARRTLDGRATVTLSIGAAAPSDVTVAWSLHAVERAPDGSVNPAAEAPGIAPRATRLRPGETGSFVASIPVDGEPALLVAELRGAGADATSDTTPTTLATLLLPGPAPDGVAVSLVEEDGVLAGELAADRPTLVTIRLRGRDTTTYPERLLLPAAPLVVEGVPARWPAPSLLTVTDERGTVAAVDTGTGAFAVVAALLVLLAVGGLTLSVRHHRSAAGELP